MADKHVEKFRGISTYAFAYMRDLTGVMHHAIKPLNPDSAIVGRAYTVTGPDIYLNAYESIPEGAVYVHADASENAGVWSGRMAEMYGKPRGLVGAVIDGGVNAGQQTADYEDAPTFARFVTPRPAINRKEGVIQVPVVCGDVTVCPGDIIVADADGVVVVPQGNETEVYENVDRLRQAFAVFIRISKEPNMIMTEHHALRELFAMKYDHPKDYWRYYVEWAVKWKDEYPPIDEPV